MQHNLKTNCQWCRGMILSGCGLLLCKMHVNHIRLQVSYLTVVLDASALPAGGGDPRYSEYSWLTSLGLSQSTPLPVKRRWCSPSSATLPGNVPIGLATLHTITLPVPWISRGYQEVKYYLLVRKYPSYQEFQYSTLHLSKQNITTTQ